MYLKTKEIAEQYSISRSTVYRIIEEMQALGRYPRDAIIGARKMRRIDEDALRDYMINIDQLRHPTMRRYVKPYRKEKKR